jgi:hypothetical protein
VNTEQGQEREGGCELLGCGDLGGTWVLFSCEGGGGKQGDEGKNSRPEAGSWNVVGADRGTYRLSTDLAAALAAAALLETRVLLRRYLAQLCTPTPVNATTFYCPSGQSSTFYRGTAAGFSYLTGPPPGQGSTRLVCAASQRTLAIAPYMTSPLACEWKNDVTDQCIAPGALQPGFFNFLQWPFGRRVLPPSKHGCLAVIYSPLFIDTTQDLYRPFQPLVPVINKQRRQRPQETVPQAAIIKKFPTEMLVRSV